MITLLNLAYYIHCKIKYLIDMEICNLDKSCLIFYVGMYCNLDKYVEINSNIYGKIGVMVNLKIFNNEEGEKI